MTNYKKKAIAMIPVLAVAPLVQAQQRMNIIHIMSDDHSYQAISAYGHQLSAQAPTPNIDRLAAEGVLFRRAYVENSLSTPARACLMTGLYSHQNGQRRLGKGIDSTKTFIPELIHEAGYQTCAIGKWHMRCEPKGFDWYSVFNDQGEYYNPGFKTPLTNGKFVRQEGYATNLVTEQAIDFLEQRDTTKPFCLYVLHKAPHREWLPNEKFLEEYEDITFPTPETFYDDYSDRGPAVKNQEMTIYKHMRMVQDLKYGTRKEIADQFRRADPAQRERIVNSYLRRNAAYVDSTATPDERLNWKYQRYVHDYLRVIKSVDESVGEILDYLDEHGLAENTIVVYCSDQGFYMGEHGWFDKRFMFEESFRTPLIIRAPGLVKTPGVDSEALVQNIDFGPTYLDVAGAKPTDEMTGRSLLPVLRNNGAEPKKWRKYLYYHYYDYPAIHMVSRHDGVFDKRFKLFHFYDLEGKTEPYDELYDLKNDPNELHNVINDPKYKKDIKRLNKVLNKFRKDLGTDEM